MAGFCMLGGTDVEVEEGQCTVRRVPIGSIQRMFAGNAVSSIRAHKWEADVVTYNMTPAAEAALRALCNNGMTPVTWTGTIINGASVQAFVEFTDTTPVNVGSDVTHARKVGMTIREV